MVRHSGLGKGLSSLIPTETVHKQEGLVYREVPVNYIKPNHSQPRKYFDEEAISSLAASINEVGILQPILLRELEENVYELVAGERRWRAAKRVGLLTIPSFINVETDTSSLIKALIENLHREGLNALEEAAGYQQLLEELNITHDELAKRVGKSRATITNTIRLLQLPAGVQKLILDKQLTAGHARALLGTPDRTLQEELAKRVVNEGLSVRAVEEVIKDRENSKPDNRVKTAPKNISERDPSLVELEVILSDYLNTRVKVDITKKHGVVVIEFANIADLERIYKLIIPPRV
ncbi:MAG: ParB/RepB/Spo0J family partition protein [Actinobacteria bacterium]|nr:ParB/RepB/Spo0J family partition protein [Actinomycetota bacterium]MCL6104285.1 ParB/RepB/Spo0J family partition protein [Actinomycetota bacterium]